METQGTTHPGKIQVIDHIEVKIRIQRLNARRNSKINQEMLAKRMGRDQSVISDALNGKNPKLLERIHRHIARLEGELAAKIGQSQTTVPG